MLDFRRPDAGIRYHRQSKEKDVELDSLDHYR